MKTARTLIEAVQLGNLKHLQVTIDAVTKGVKLPAHRVRAVSDGLPQSGLTALHVACKIYSVTTDPVQAFKYNSMIKILLTAGAEPYAECLVEGAKLTPMELAGRNRPPALVEHIQVRRTHEHGQGKGRDSSLSARAARAGLNEKAFETLSGGYGCIYAVGGHSTYRDANTSELASDLEGLRAFGFLEKGEWSKRQNKINENRSCKS